MFDNISAVRDNTERIIDLLEGGAAPAYDEPHVVEGVVVHAWCTSGTRSATTRRARTSCETPSSVFASLGSTGVDEIAAELYETISAAVEASCR